MKSLARVLRRNATDAERLLWKYIRGRRLAGCKFRRQFVIEPYIVDFICLEAKLIVEADGGQHAEQINNDAKRTAFLESLGYKIMRFWNHEILGDINAVLERIYCFLIAPSITVPDAILPPPSLESSSQPSSPEGEKELSRKPFYAETGSKS